MFCIICGARNGDEAIYCQKCGALLEAEEETRVARQIKIEPKNLPENADEAEIEIFSISPTLMFVKIGYVLAAIGALFLVALFATLLPSVSIWIAILLAFALFLIPAFYHFKQKTIRYTLTDSKIEIDEGFVFQNSRSIPLRSIQDVSVASTITQRMLGFGNLVVDNASESGGKVILKNINSPKKYADVLLKQMRRLNR